MMNTIFRLFRGLPLLFVFLFVNGCEAVWPFSSIDEIPVESSHHLKVGVLQNPMVYTKDFFGYEKDLINKFAQDLSYKVKWIPFRSSTEILSALELGTIDVGLSRFNPDLSYKFKVLQGPAYEESPLSLICPRTNKEIEDNSSLFQKVFGSKYSIPKSVKNVTILNHQNIGEWKQSFSNQYGELSLIEVNQRQNLDLLKAVSRNRSSCALIEKTEALFYLRLFPSLQIVKDLTPPISISFLISKNRPEVQNLLYSWFRKSNRNRTVESVRDQYISHLKVLDEMDLLRFFRDIQIHYQTLIPKFKKVAKEFGLPWQLIAAVAYQESHWDNDAESFTGVTGIMMLTEETADHLGIEDRTDLDQSLWGGAKYLRYLIQSQPKFLNPRTRMILALASYNVGFAHLRDVQKLSVQRGMNPYSWKALKMTLPMLSQPEVYPFLEFGEARGQEPIDFVNRVLSFYEILSTPI